MEPVALTGIMALGFWFWTITLFEVIVFISLVCNRRWFLPIVTIFGLMLIYQFLFKLNIWGTLVGNPFIVLGVFCVYFIGGVPWSFARWIRLVSKRAYSYNKVKREWLKTQMATEEEITKGDIPERFKNNWIELFTDIYGRNHKVIVDVVSAHKILGHPLCEKLAIDPGESVCRIPPKAREHKGDILFWITYWPIDIFWMIFHDFIIDFANTVYNSIAGSYQRIANSKFRVAESDFIVNEKVEQDRE